jgi:diadenosine tetraphosphate (Ap4A) HIT family hydrolase
MPADCYACRLTEGTEPLPGGRISATVSWVVEHCTGPLGVGTLIVKPLRHCLHLGDLTPAEAQELGPLLQRVSRVVQTLTQADQVYVCLWCHAGWQPVHLHFVVQPAWNSWREAYTRPGPSVQASMFQTGNASLHSEVEAFCHQAKIRLEQSAGAAALI